MVEILTFVKTGDCPPGWEEETALINKIPAGDVSANAEDTGGVTTTNHTHTVSYGAYFRHESSSYYGNSGTSSGGPTGGAITLDPPYVKVRYCKKIYNLAEAYPRNSMMMFLGACPGGWTTQDTYEGYQPRGASSSLGTTGSTGAAHTHTFSHSSTRLYSVHYKYYQNGTFPCTTGNDDFLSSTELFSCVKVVICKKN